MYNFNLLNDEKLIKVFDDIWISQNEKEKNTTVALTNQRLLFMDYDKNDYREDLRVGRGVNYIRYKEVYYFLELKNINSISKKEDFYSINIKNSNSIEFDNTELYKLLKKTI